MKNLVTIFIILTFSTAMFGQVDRSQPKPGPSPKVNLGKPQTFELSNGLKVLVVENHKLPRVIINLNFDNPLKVNGNKAGVDDLMGDLLGNGTSKIAKDDYLEEIDYMGATLNFHADGAYANILSRYFPRTLELLAQGAIDPLFTQEDFDKEKNRTIDGIKSQDKNVAYNAGRVQQVLAYGSNHPFGEFVTEEKIKSITLDDIKSNYKNYFAPNNAYLIIIGDVEYGEVKKLVEKDFNNWKKSTIPTSKYEDPTNVTKTEIDFVNMPNAVQSEISTFNTHHLKMTDKDYFATLVANQILGGGGEGRLFLNLREAHGWTYGSYSRASGSKHVEKFATSASVRNEVTDSAIVELMNELKRIRTEKVSDDELANAKAKIIGNFVMDAEKPEVIASQAFQMQTQNLPADFYQNYIANISSVTAQEVLDAAKKYFGYENARILVVGKASDVLATLEKLPYPIHYFDRFGNATAQPEEKKIDANVTVASVLEKYIHAIGGSEKLTAVKNVTSKAEGTIQGMTLVVTSVNTSDGKSLTDVSMMGQTMMKSVFDGNGGYNSQQGQKKELDEKEILESKYYSLPFPELILGKKEGIKLTGIENFNGNDAYVIVDGKKNLYFDVTTGLKIGESETVSSAPQPMTQTTIFSDYQEVEGIKFPHKINLNIGMEIPLEVKEIKLNQELSTAYFQ